MRFSPPLTSPSPGPRPSPRDGRTARQRPAALTRRPETVAPPSRVRSPLPPRRQTRRGRGRPLPRRRAVDRETSGRGRRRTRRRPGPGPRGAVTGCAGRRRQCLCRRRRRGRIPPAEPARLPPLARPPETIGPRPAVDAGRNGNLGRRGLQAARDAGGRGGHPRRELRRITDVACRKRPDSCGRAARLPRPAATVRHDENVLAALRAAIPGRATRSRRAAIPGITFGSA